MFALQSLARPLGQLSCQRFREHPHDYLNSARFEAVRLSHFAGHTIHFSDVDFANRLFVHKCHISAVMVDHFLGQVAPLSMRSQA